MDWDSLGHTSWARLAGGGNTSPQHGPWPTSVNCTPHMSALEGLADETAEAEHVADVPEADLQKVST